MNAPILNSELVLECPSRVQDTGGGADLIWTETGTLWAEVRAINARERITGGREAGRVTHRVMVRSAPVGSPRRPTPDCRFRTGERVFAIRGVAEVDQRGKYLTCWVEEGPFQ